MNSATESLENRCNTTGGLDYIRTNVQNGVNRENEKRGRENCKRTYEVESREDVVISFFQTLIYRGYSNL